MKIYKVNLDPSNPVEKLVKVPVGSDYGLQIIWDNEKYPMFTDSEVTTQNGYLVSENSTATEMTDITTVAGQKTFLSEGNISLPKVSNVGDTIVWVYNPTNTTDKTASTFGSIKILGVDADDFEIDLGSSGGGTDGVVDGLYNIPVEVGTEFELTSLKTVYKTIPESASTLTWSVPSDMPTNAIITFWLWVVMGDTAHELTFPMSVTFIDDAPALAANTETMLALTSTDGGTTWLANTQWVK